MTASVSEVAPDPKAADGGERVVAFTCSASCWAKMDCLIQPDRPYVLMCLLAYHLLKVGDYFNMQGACSLMNPPDN